ncbi:CPBP family intramembrane glutamic endopeptidase [Liquorilactobacillus capillatus]|uniref:Membrane-bound protease CAAX family immunity protein PlnI n=1 Tax=Liquorilactobacillus capillatus TaxID=480931 RepID=A0A0A7RKV0_9LACO|nr:CPBP family intramembrane glutamic endopeptidase [Liquorilactobacillus capillatus]AJA33843.1 membrane-bound protease CAAX family immunity protein PlnI [Liquorilactobacillus capillatus]
MINVKKETFLLVLLVVINFLLELSVFSEIQAALNISGMQGLFFYKTCSLISLLCLNYFITKQTIYFRFKMSANIVKAMLLLPAVFFIFFIAGSKNIPAAFSIGILGAVPEEYLFRGIVLAKMLRLFAVKLNNQKLNMIISAILSSAAFGAMHLINLSHQPLGFTVAQMAQTFGFGMLLAAVYLKSGSIVFPMLVHFALDSIVILMVGYSKAMSGSQHVSVLLTIVMLGIYTSISVGMILDSNENKLLKKIWKNTYGVNEAGEVTK